MSENIRSRSDGGEWKKADCNVCGADAGEACIEGCGAADLADPCNCPTCSGDVGSSRLRWKDAALQALDDLRDIEREFVEATPPGEEGPNPPIGPGQRFAEWTRTANTMRWIERLKGSDDADHPEPPEAGEEDTVSLALELLRQHCDPAGETVEYWRAGEALRVVEVELARLRRRVEGLSHECGYQECDEYGELVTKLQVVEQEAREAKEALGLHPKATLAKIREAATPHHEQEGEE